jgi:hypothetical protein
MSSAVDSFWNFQLVESEDKDNNILISVIDENWIGTNPGAGAVRFEHSGVGSPFLNSSLDISIPAEMANMIINNRLDVRNQNDIKNVPVGSFFRAKRDLFLSRTGGSGASGTSGTSGTSGAGETPEQRRQRLIREEDDKIVRNESSDPVVTSTSSTVTTTFYDAAGTVIKKSVFRTEFGGGGLAGSTRITTYTNRELGVVTEEETEEAREAITLEESARLTQFLEKIDPVPNPIMATVGSIGRTVDSLKGLINKAFYSFCLDDTDYFNTVRNYYFAERKPRGNTLSQPLPIKYSFTILGNSGIQRGDTFNILGIPQKYRDKGLFQVSAIEHSIQGMRWETTVEGLYRQIT